MQARGAPFLVPPDLVVSLPGFHRGRALLSVPEGRVEYDEIVVQVRIPPAAEPSVLMAEYLFFHHTASEQRSSVRLSARFVLAANEPIQHVSPSALCCGHRFRHGRNQLVGCSLHQSNADEV